MNKFSFKHIVKIPVFIVTALFLLFASGLVSPAKADESTEACTHKNLEYSV